jgi:hypothetical protein
MWLEIAGLIIQLPWNWSIVLCREQLHTVLSRSVDGARLMATAVYKSSPSALDQPPPLGHDFSITERGDSGEPWCSLTTPSRGPLCHSAHVQLVKGLTCYGNRHLLLGYILFALQDCSVQTCTKFLHMRPWGTVALTTRHSCIRKVGRTSPTSGGRSVGIVRSQTQVTEFSLKVKHEPRYLSRYSD